MFIQTPNIPFNNLGDEGSMPAENNHLRWTNVLWMIYPYLLQPDHGELGVVNVSLGGLSLNFAGI